jgi:hypothetical protein
MKTAVSGCSDHSSSHQQSVALHVWVDIQISIFCEIPDIYIYITTNLQEDNKRQNKIDI